MGMDGDHPRLRLARGRVHRAVAAHLTGRTRAWADPLLRARNAALSAVPGHARRRADRAGKPFDHSALTVRRQHGYEAPQPGRDSLSPGWCPRRTLLAR